MSEKEKWRLQFFHLVDPVHAGNHGDDVAVRDFSPGFEGCDHDQHPVLLRSSGFGDFQITDLDLLLAQPVDERPVVVGLTELNLEFQMAGRGDDPVIEPVEQRNGQEDTDTGDERTFVESNSDCQPHAG